MTVPMLTCYVAVAARFDSLQPRTSRSDHTMVLESSERTGVMKMDRRWWSVGGRSMRVTSGDACLLKPERVMRNMDRATHTRGSDERTMVSQ